MMTQSSALSPIGSHGTREPGRRAKAFSGVRRRGAARAQRPGVWRVGQVMSPILAPRAAVTHVAMASVAVLAGALTATPAAAATPGSVLAPPGGRDGDHLTVTVRHAGAGRDGTYRLSCHPGSGSHPDVAGACGVVDGNTRWGSEPFAPVPPGSVCTMRYGGPATAHVTGTWAGRPVDATYDRSGGCEIDRWNRMVPLLPDLGGQPFTGFTDGPRTVHGRIPRRGKSSAEFRKISHTLAKDRRRRSTRSHVPRHFVVRPPSHPAPRAQPLPLDSLA